MSATNPRQSNEADKAKKVILQCIAEGLTIEEACKVAGKSVKTYEYYRRSDTKFKSLSDRTRLGAINKNFSDAEVSDLDFVNWRRRFLKSETFPPPAQPD